MKECFALTEKEAGQLKKAVDVLDYIESGIDEVLIGEDHNGYVHGKLEDLSYWANCVKEALGDIVNDTKSFTDYLSDFRQQG